MEELKSLEQIEKPGLWFVYSMQPTLELCRYIYQLAVETGLHLTVYSSASEEEIQNNVFDLIKNNCIENASNESERNWLEQELSEYNTHGYFCSMEELNEYVPKGSFWSNNVIIDDFKIFNINHHDIHLIDNISELFEEESDISKVYQMLEQEAIDYKNTIIIFERTK